MSGCPLSTRTAIAVTAMTIFTRGALASPNITSVVVPSP